MCFLYLSSGNFTFVQQIKGLVYSIEWCDAQTLWIYSQEKIFYSKLTGSANRNENCDDIEKDQNCTNLERKTINVENETSKCYTLNDTFTLPCANVNMASC